MPLDHAWIMAHIPHQGSMCLLDEVTHWDAERISCRSSSHANAANPLRAHGRLGILCGVEYAAQAMAVHGALASGVPARTGTTAGTATTSAGSAGTATAEAAVCSTATAAAAVGIATTAAGPGGTAIAAAAMAGTAAPVAASAQPPAAGFLAALRGVTAHVSRLDDVAGDLIVTALRVAGDQASALYEFEVRSAVGCLLSGRATVVLDANLRLRS